MRKKAKKIKKNAEKTLTKKCGFANINKRSARTGTFKTKIRRSACAPYSFIWGYSSAGRAPALQAGGHRFDPDYLHH